MRMEDAEAFLAQSAARLAQIRDIVAIQPPYIQDIRLRPYQIQGVNFLLRMDSAGLNAVLADDMGAGKTIQLLSTCCVIFHRDRSDQPKFLVVAPLSTVSQWQLSCETHCRSLLRSGIYHAECPFRGDAHYMRDRLDLIITSYDILVRDFSVFRKLSFRLVVVDEAHRLKNAGAVFYQRTEELMRTSKRLVLATGTPIQNSKRELWSILHLVAPRQMDSADDFEGYPDSLIRRIFAHFAIRRTKQQVLQELPRAHEFVIWTQFNNLQRSLYRSILLKTPLFATGRRPSSAAGTSVSTLRNLAMQLRKCVDHPYLFPGVEPPPYDVGEHLVLASSKLIALDALLTALREQQGSKVLIFSQFTSMLDILQDYVEYRRWPYQRLDGSVRAEDRSRALAEFKTASSDDCFVFLISTRAGGVGLNLEQADTVVFYDSDWNPFVDLQAQDRVLRIGQKRTVRVFRLVMRDSIDDVIVRRAQRKMDLFHKLVARQQQELAEDPFHAESLIIQDPALHLQHEPAESLAELIKFGLHRLEVESAAVPASWSGRDESYEQIAKLQMPELEANRQRLLGTLRALVTDSLSAPTQQGSVADAEVCLVPEREEPAKSAEVDAPAFGTAEAAAGAEERMATAASSAVLETAMQEEDPSIYWYNGKDFKEDARALERMLAGQRAALMQAPLRLRGADGGRGIAAGGESSEEEEAERSEEALTAALLEPMRKRKPIEPIEELWKRNNYVSFKIQPTAEEMQADDDLVAAAVASSISEDASGTAAGQRIVDVHGDCSETIAVDGVGSADVQTQSCATDSRRMDVVLMPVDSSGSLSKQGLPTRHVAGRWPELAKAYAWAKKNRDVHAGDVHCLRLADDSSLPDSGELWGAFLVAVDNKTGDVDANLLRCCLQLLRIFSCQRHSGCRVRWHLNRPYFQVYSQWYQCQRTLAVGSEGMVALVVYHFRGVPSAAAATRVDEDEKERRRIESLPEMLAARTRSLWENQRVLYLVADRDPERDSSGPAGRSTYLDCKRHVLRNGGVWLHAPPSGAVDVVLVDEQPAAAFRHELQQMLSRWKVAPRMILKLSIIRHLDKLPLAAITIPVEFIYS